MFVGVRVPPFAPDGPSRFPWSLPAAPRWNILCSESQAMRQFSILILSLLLAACARPTAQPSELGDPVLNVKTMASVEPKPVMLDPPPMLQNDAPIPKASQTERNAGAAPPLLTEQDEEIRSKLPFAPAIAMDPVDGNKISILATTPTFEFKGKIYYFSSAEHRATFVANPEQFTKGSLSNL